MSILSLLPCLISFLTCSAFLYAVPYLHVYDIPQARSAHKNPIPKGGGIAILLGTLLGSFAWYSLPLKIGILFSLSKALAAILLLAVFSWIDDIQSQKVWLKLLIQILSAFLAMEALDLNLLQTLFLTVWSVIFINAVNFMDGLNGLAASVMALSSLFLFIAGAPEIICLPLASALIAFLPWNFPKARLFMGDVGSQSCALVLCVAGGALFSAHHFPSGLRQIILLPCLLNGVLFDVFLTLLRRFLKGDPLTQAHNTHLYQYAARSLLLPPANVSFLEIFFTFWGGLVNFYVPLSLILPLLLVPQLVWAFIVLNFWMKNLP